MLGGEVFRLPAVSPGLELRCPVDLVGVQFVGKNSFILRLVGRRCSGKRVSKKAAADTSCKNFFLKCEAVPMKTKRLLREPCTDPQVLLLGIKV